MEHPYFWWGGMWIFPILLLAAVVFGIYAIVRRGNTLQSEERARARSAETPVAESAMEILEKRYARGEISREEFLQMKKDMAD